MSPHILCLQETEMDSGLNDYVRTTLNYSGYFMKKNDDSRKDGCATFFDSRKFIMLEKFELPYNFNPRSGLYCKPNLGLILAL